MFESNYVHACDTACTRHRPGEINSVYRPHLNCQKTQHFNTLRHLHAMDFVAAETVRNLADWKQRCALSTSSSVETRHQSCHRLNK